MALSIGIIGLPNVGKSTLFNALTQSQNAEVANYPFCTVQPNKAIVPLPDWRLDQLADLVKVPHIIHAAIEFVDIAGLVRDAHKGEGLGNQFLGHIRDTDAILHVVRCFEDPNVVHVSAQLNPQDDIEIINLELAMADLEQLDRKIERLSSQVKGDKKLVDVLELCTSIRSHLSSGKPVSAYPGKDHDDFSALVKELRFLTAKPVIFVANVDECGMVNQNRFVDETMQAAAKSSAETIPFCAKLEAEILEFEGEERLEMMEIAGISENGLARVIRKSFDVLGLISFFTKNENEVRAWEIPQGTKASRAAGVIHTDFERGFIRAEVVPFDTFAELGSDTKIRAAGKLRLEGRDYVVQDGDIIFFRFNV